jgi:ABC-type glycerol-3-phosphate transport system substrate-binding protein
MKKVIAIFAIATTLVACGGNASTEATTDSTAVDSTVVAVDSAAVVADTTAVAPAEVK